MAWYNFWKMKPEAPLEGAAVVGEPAVVFINVPKEVAKTQWRTGMWVFTDRGIGILVKMGLDSTVDLVDEKGETYNSYITKFQLLRQATFDEIPEPRRRGITRDAAKLLGYQ